MKRIIITESQFKSLIQESLGIPNDIVAAAKEIVNDIVGNYLYILDDYEEYTEYAEDASFVDYASDACDDIGITDVMVNGEVYYYGFFYSLRNVKGQYDYNNEAVMINYKGIQNIIEQAKSYYSSDDLEAIHDFIETSLYEYLLPILTHELTHSKDEEGEAQGKWLGVCYKGNEENLRDILYTFSENEMNARIGSVGGLVTSFIENTNFGINFERSEFDDLSKEIMSDNDLQIDYMAVLIDMLYRELDDISKTDDRNNFKNYSLCYDLFRNDTRLKNNRTLKMLFDKNKITAYKYVVNFYEKLLINYKKKVLRAIWHIWNSLPQVEE